MNKFHGRSELVNGRIMWAIYRGPDSAGFGRDLFIAYFENHKEAVEFIKTGMLA